MPMATIAGIEHHLSLRGLRFGIFTEHLGIVLQRELDLGKTLLHLVGDSGKIAAAGIGRDIDPTPEIFAGDDVGARLDADICDFLQSHRATIGRVDQQLAERCDVVAGVRRAPDLDIVGTSGLEQVTDFRPGNQGGRGPAHIAWLQTIFLGLSKVGRDIDLRHLLLQVDEEILNAVDVEAIP